ncbi:hypothetical protein MMC29_006036 [Sticta canariensis]|nr:hypothetical protein [Sticta canariensis]
MLSLNIPSYALDYTTPRPSPLSYRNLNICAQSIDQMKYSSKPTTRLGHSGNRGQAISPLQHIFAEQDRRRKDFLRKAQQARDDKKWRSRGDQILREDYVSRRKEWEQEQAKSVPEIPMAPEDEEKEFRQESWSKVAGEGGMEPIDDILQHEGQELDMLISRLEKLSSTVMERKETETVENENYGSDDEEYLRLCVEAVSAIEARDGVCGDTQEVTAECVQDMDVSSG